MGQTQSATKPQSNRRIRVVETDAKHRVTSHQTHSASSSTTAASTITAADAQDLATRGGRGQHEQNDDNDDDEEYIAEFVYASRRIDSTNGMP
jgi:hypothetical protein